ncbi:MAG: hypothetical protein NTZ16_03385 [Verrucomicrobia bacterium]|nr:hypothetical protein [Verrucomicrobiota bacterium]
MKPASLNFCFAAGLFIASAAALCAQNYSIEWSTIDGGGGTSTGGVYAVSGTIGQPDAGPTMSGGNYSVDGGFWGVMAVVQTPGAPLLSITKSGGNAVISWPVPATGFVLQTNANVGNPAGWGNFSGSVSDNGTTKSVTLPAQPGNSYFRLKQ